MAEPEKSNILNFKEMLTPQVITFVYWLGLAAIVFIGVAGMVSGEVGTGLMVLIGGFIGWRMWCELLIVLFKINENIQRIADRGTDMSV